MPKAKTKAETQEEVKEKAYQILGQAIEVIGNKNRAEITQYIKDHKEATFEVLRKELGLNASVLSFHLKKLKKAYIVSQPVERGSYKLGELGEVMLLAREGLEQEAHNILRKLGSKLN